MSATITENGADDKPFAQLNIDTTTIVNGVSLALTDDGRGGWTLGLQAPAGAPTGAGGSTVLKLLDNGGGQFTLSIQ